jgi:hypothetical protein
VEYNTSGNTPFLPLGVLQLMTNQGAWSVRIRPNFQSGPGIYGPPQLISVSNSAASSIMPDEALVGNNEKNLMTPPIASIYPNPCNGIHLSINLLDVLSETVIMEIFDETGRKIYNQTFPAKGSMSTTVLMDQTLCSGLYLVRFVMDDKILIERLVVQKEN